MHWTKRLVNAIPKETLYWGSEQVHVEVCDIPLRRDESLPKQQTVSADEVRSSVPQRVGLRCVSERWLVVWVPTSEECKCPPHLRGDDAPVRVGC